MRYSIAIFLLLLSFNHAFSQSARSINKALLLQLINNARSKGCTCGDVYYSPAPPLKWNDQLASAAEAHSADMAAGHYFSHIASSGKGAGRRIQEQGYNWKAYAENIAEGYATEADVIKGWLRSPGHCRNLMDKTYTEVGVGRSGTYWTQDFGLR